MILCHVCMTEAKLHFDIYDLDGCGKVDAKLLGDLVRSLDLKPTDAAVEKAGGAKKKGEHFGSHVARQIDRHATLQFYNCIFNHLSL